jgi:hypothetical protein
MAIDSTLADRPLTIVDPEAGTSRRLMLIDPNNLTENRVIGPLISPDNSESGVEIFEE